jgi:hypothetical protein
MLDYRYGAAPELSLRRADSAPHASLDRAGLPFSPGNRALPRVRAKAAPELSLGVGNFCATRFAPLRGANTLKNGNNTRYSAGFRAGPLGLTYVFAPIKNNRSISVL